ncbi:RNA-guided endonuclease InsQ/TnpB family protein [Deinococcus marmoris]|uniref:RNA-guided endonuclease InsQ/TnpB family protein n=1 Tax=Deinococcus marmoris TaxID=249408 RepID=UPI00068E2C68|nr:RNA-guided endonuclease TnpB family protein [Deinococcus marmoris]
MSVRVLKLKLRTVNRGKFARLTAMQREYAACAQFHLEGIERLQTTNATALHRELYVPAKERFTLPVVNLQRARDKAIETFRSYLARKAKGKRANVPQFGPGLPLGVGQRALAIVGRTLRLSTEKARDYLWLPIEVDDRHAPFVDAVAAGTLKYGASELHRRGKDWYLHLTVYEDVPNTVESGVVLGLDLGVANTAVMSGPGLVRFWSGQAVRHTRNRYSARRRSLQKAKLMGEVRRSKGKESRWMRNLNHQISCQILGEVAQQGAALAIEKLLGIRDRVKLTRKVNRMVHNWAFGELIALLHQKAPRYGVRIVEVDPRHTSQGCSKCGHTEKGNRLRQDRFKCKACGYAVHADLNAARNIANRGALMLGYTSSVTGALTVPGGVKSTSVSREFGDGQAMGVEAEGSSDQLKQSQVATSLSSW